MNTKQAKPKRKREYRCWVKGKKEKTLCIFEAESAALARIRFALSKGLHSYEVEAIWVQNL